MRQMESPLQLRIRCFQARNLQTRLLALNELARSPQNISCVSEVFSAETRVCVSPCA